MMLPSAAQYLRSLRPEEKKAIYEQCGITRQYFYNLLGNPNKKASVELACRMQQVTRGRVTRRSLRPDLDWDLIERADSAA